MLFLYGIIVIILLICGALSAASETAFTSSSIGKMQKLKSGGDKRAAIIMNLFKSKERVISSLLITNNLVNIVATSVITTLFLKLFGNQGVLYSTVIMSVLIIVFGEVLPKHLAVLSPEKWALFFAYILYFIVKILTPINAVLGFVVKSVMRIFKLQPKNIFFSAEDEVKGMIDYQHEVGNVVKNDRDMLGGVLDLKQITVGDIMIHRKDIFMINYDRPIVEIVKASLSKPYTRIPLWSKKKDNVIGILHTKDLLKEIERNSFDLNKTRREYFIREPWFISESMSVSDQLHLFREKRNHFALVVDEYGGLEGLITLEDILEEIVGNIEDEHDIYKDQILVTNNGYVFDGSLNIRDVNRQIGWNLPESASTVAGLLIHEIQKIPEEGEIFEILGFEVQIMKKNGNSIERLRFKKLF